MSKSVRPPYSGPTSNGSAQHNSPLPYFRLQDPLCRRFFEAVNPVEFEGFKLMFPFIREMSVQRFSRTSNKIAVWMRLAFMAGHDLGRAQPDRLEDVAPAGELKAAEARLDIIEHYSRERALTYQGLVVACNSIVDTQWSTVPDPVVEDIVYAATIKSLRTGFVAATIARMDPAKCEFVSDIPDCTHAGIRDIAGKVLVGAPVKAVGKSIVELLEHPLLRLARAKYPQQPTEGDTVLGFLRSRLQALGVKSENDCPTSELDLIDWIAAGIAYGRRVKAQHPEVVERIFNECGEKRLRDSLEVVRRVVREAGGVDPVRLLGRLKQWHQDAYGWLEPGFYGEELSVVVNFSDFAVWIPWATE